jgi:TRAP-type C4-dicarboxylate transport system permease small subunit
MNLLFRLKPLVDWTLRALLVVLFITLFGCVILQVFTRYVLNDPAVFTEEVSRYSMIWLSLIGCAYASGRLEHMAYTMIPERLSGAKLLAHMRSVAAFVLSFAATVMVYGGGKLVARALQFNQQTATMGWPMGYVYFCIPLSGALIVFYQILILMKPEHFKAVDEVKSAIDHAAEEERKLAEENNHIGEKQS